MSLPKVATKKQRRLYKFAMKRKYSIWAVDPRLGKSLVGIAIQQKLNKPCLVICPSYLVANWDKEIRKWAKPDVQVTMFRAAKKIYEPFDHDFIIISYDLAQKAKHLFEWAHMVILDEVHHLKTMSTKRTQFIHKEIYENSIPRVYALSGTILKNRVKEFYSPLAVMHYDPNSEKKQSGKDLGRFIVLDEQTSSSKSDFLERFTDEIEFADYFSFREEFNVPVRTKKGQFYYMPVPKWTGLRNLDELKRYRRGHYIRIKASEKDLPPLDFKKVLISKTPNKKLLKAFNDYFDQDGTDSVKPDIKVEAALQKVPFTIEYVEDLLTSVERVCIYSDHVEPVEKIAKHFGVPPITGKMSAKRRARLAKEFQEGKSQVLVATIGALKEGQDLFIAKDLVLNDPAWVPGDLKQVFNRIRGLGQKDPRTVHEIYGSPQDGKISASLKEKIETIDRAT